MKQQNSRETQVRGMRELEAINGEKGNIFYFNELFSILKYFFLILNMCV